MGYKQEKEKRNEENKDKGSVNQAGEREKRMTKERRKESMCEK